MPIALKELLPIETVFESSGHETAGSRAMQENLGDPSEKELKEYLEAIPNNSQTPQGPFDVTTPERFVPFVSKLFQISRSKIGVFTDHLCRASGNNPLAGIKPNLAYWSAAPIIESAREFLEQENSVLEIIVRNQIDSDQANGFAGSEFLREIIEHRQRKGSITIYACSSKLSKDVDLVSSCFIVADDNGGYRVEGDTDWLKGIGGLHNEKQNRKLLFGLEQMRLSLEDAVQQRPKGTLVAPQPVKFVFDADTFDVENPSLISPNVSMKQIDLASYFYDQSECPAEPLSLVRTGLVIAREQSRYRISRSPC